jgi:6-phosphogluconate dehydrogenase
MEKAQFGMVGLGTMGRNFLLNVAEKGISGVGYDLDATKRDLLISEAGGLEIVTAANITSLTAALETPRRVMLLVPAGPIVDSVIHDLIPKLDKGDMVIDGGNSHFSDTERREALLKEKGIEFLGVGVSGGEEGARHGASIMAGGSAIAYEHIRPIMEAAAAKVDGEPCAALVGHGSAGHFVKMVHNGIEYAMMQLIAESYDLLGRGLGMTASEIALVFGEWNRGELDSFLMEISAAALRKIDDKTGRPLVDVILDTAGQKGTGKWTSQAAMDLGVPVPTIDSAVAMRQISARKSERISVSGQLKQVIRRPGPAPDDPKHVAALEAGLHLGFLVSFAQGLSLLKEASAERGYDIDLRRVVTIWRGGCIIRARMLETIRAALEGEGNGVDPVGNEIFLDAAGREVGNLSQVVQTGAEWGIPCMGFASVLNYVFSFASERLPANLIQAQRDLFGAHTYQRMDEPGTFHTEDWV